MKTTVDVSDAILAATKQLAAKEETTLRALVEEGLRLVLARRKETRTDFRLRDASVSGEGLQPGVREGDWRTVRDLAYEGRGS